MTADEYLRQILADQAVDNGSASPALAAANALYPSLAQWGGTALVSIQASGSFAKGTANRAGTDIDLFISLSHTLALSLKDIYDKLFEHMTEAKLKPRRQNVSINVRLKSAGGAEYDVDLVPAKRQSGYGEDHSLYVSKAQTWKQTNIQTHIATVIAGGRQAETRIIKLWRGQKGLEFPSFYIELAVIEALRGKNGGLAANVMDVFAYLANGFANARITDPANTNNIISETLTLTEKAAIKMAAGGATRAANWADIIT